MSTSARVKYKYINNKYKCTKTKSMSVHIKKETDDHCTHFLQCEMWD